MTHNRKLIKDCGALILLFVAALSLTFYRGAANSFNEGLKLWYACVLPTLFPYLFITAAIAENKAAGRLFNKLSPVSSRIFKVNGCGLYAFFLSLISGYPVGAKVVSDLYKKGALSETETLRSAALCSTSSPVFVILSVGGAMFSDVKFGILLYITHFISALAVGVTFSFYKRKDKPLKTDYAFTRKSAAFLYETAENSVITVLVVGGLIAVFYLLTDMVAAAFSPLIGGLCEILGSESFGKGIFFSLFECTKGLKHIAAGGGFMTLPVCAAVIGFGGLSVIAQSMAFLKSAKIKTATFVLIKLFTSAVNFTVGIIVSLIFIL